MSGQPPGTPVPGSAGTAPSTGGGGMNLPPQTQQQQPGNAGSATAGTGGAAGGGGAMGAISPQNLNSIVIEYLCKKGYSRTEAMLRIESSATDKEGRPIINRAEDAGGEKYMRAFILLRVWIEQSLDIYKPEYKRLLWPIFVYSFLNLAEEFYPRECEAFFNKFKDLFVADHEDDIRKLSPIYLPEHATENEIAQLYRTHKYRITLTSVAYFNLVQFLEAKDKEGGTVLINVLQRCCEIKTVDRGPSERHSLAALLSKNDEEEDSLGQEDGIPGHRSGPSTTGDTAATLPKLRLGQMPMEPELMGDVQGDLEDEDAQKPPAAGQPSLVEVFQQSIKREEDEEAPLRTDLPLPPSKARDVAMEVLKVKENRDRYKLDGRTGGVGPGVSVTMFTFHNTFDSINCLDFSQDNLLVAAGTSDSYIRVWTLDGRALKPSIAPGPHEPPPSNSRRLIGHSSDVYAVSFSPSVYSPDPLPAGVTTHPQYLLSCSADKTIRLWSLDTWTCLVVYKGHMNPVWDITWGPYGHYFVTGSNDKTAQLWSTDHITSLRIFAGHDQDVDVVCFHPNSGYVFTGSCDKTVRMWSVTTGNSVRLFSGHKGNITSLACSPDGKLLASADDAGAILLWDLAPSKILKRMRGHGKGGIWSLSWSVESTILVSGGADGTVRVWDVRFPTGEAAAQQGRVVSEGGTGTTLNAGGATAGPNTTGTGVAGAGTAGSGAKKKGKDVVITPDQISAFPTKKSAVYKVHFTRKNLILAGGAYLP
ncbi:MAG: Transcription initiation factor TFIID subunit 5 [Caeruleum heppii]|nr:MAG: Transcription initiation factor TFIID subunit 5 [Caeruleum heppii]